MNRLWVKMAFISAGTAIVGVLVVALLVHNSTTNDFQNYLQSIGRMNQMMGGQGMLGGNGVNPLSPENRFLGALNNSLWIAGIVAVAVAVAAALLFSRQITKPLGRLSTAAGRIAKGDFACRVPASGADEVGALAGTFNCMAESLDQNQEARRKLLADVAHEMGTPLAVIQSNLEGMLDGVIEPSPAGIASLHHETLVLSRLVKDLRTLSLAEAGQLNLNPAPADLGALAASLVKAAEPDALLKHITLQAQSAPGLPQARIDRDRISQVLTNLLSNALRYTSEGESITLSVSHAAEGQFLQVTVADTGQGISAEDLPHVFERYYRGAQARERRVAGSGIGLTVVKELVEAHKGKVWVESAPGKGSTFYFTVPVA